MKAIRSVTILALTLAGAGAAGAQAPAGPKPEVKIEEGQINGAAFEIRTPASWNKGLVMYAHGYQLAGEDAKGWRGRASAVFDAFLSRGFAVASSDYSTQGWAVKEAIEDTEALRRYFAAKYGAPRETFITGHSMGGMITIATIERYPDVYDGALPLCGPLSPALDFFLDRTFDMLVTFEYFFPGTVGSPVNIPPDAPFEPKGSGAVHGALEASPEKAAMFARRFDLTLDELPGVLSFYRAILKELQRRAGGNALDNRSKIYSGFGDDAAVNRGVQRSAADPKAVEYIRQYYTPTGRVFDPVLTVHTTHDQLVPARDVSYYSVLAGIEGRQDLFVARFVNASGHCNISPAQTGAAFDALRAWARDRVRPPAGEIP